MPIPSRRSERNRKRLQKLYEVTPEVCEQMVSAGLLTSELTELLLTAPANMALSPVGVFGGRADVFKAGADGVPALDHAEVMPTAPDSLLVRFPRIGPDSAIEILRLN